MNKNTKLIFATIGYLFLSAIIHLSGVYYEVTFDISYWDSGTRSGVVACHAIAIIIYIICVIATFTDDKKE